MRLGILLVVTNLVSCEPLATSELRHLTEASPLRAKVEGKTQVDYYRVLDIPSDRKTNPKLYVSLSICSAQDNLETSPELFYHVGGVPIFNVQAKGWQQSSVDETFKLVNPELSGFVAKEAYADYYFGYRVAVIDLTTMKPSEDSVYVAVRIPISPLSDGAVTYQLGYSLTNFPDLQPFDFNTQLLDTSDHEASLLVNHHGVNNFTLAIFYFAEFYPSRRFNSLCSIKPIGRVRSLKVDTKNFQPTIRYLLPTDKLDHVKSFYEAYLDKLKPNTGYVGWLTVPSRSGGWSGLTFPPVYFRTKQKNPTCLLVRKLGFCDSVFHSVSLIDANTTQTNIPTSELLYRSWAENLIGQRQREAEEKYVAFMKALNQYDCKGHPYSPVRDCRDCQASYKAWMCAITFPKCADYLDANDPTNANTPPLFQLGDGAPPTIKPCAFICHFVMQDCPSLLNFRCPMGLNASLESYFPTPRGIWSWAEYELQFRNRPFSANATPPVPSSPFCNAMLSPLRLSHSNLVFKSNSQLASPSFGLALFSLLLLRLVESSHAILGYAIHNDGS